MHRLGRSQWLGMPAAVLQQSVKKAVFLDKRKCSKTQLKSQIHGNFCPPYASPEPICSLLDRVCWIRLAALWRGSRGRIRRFIVRVAGPESPKSNRILQKFRATLGARVLLFFQNSNFWPFCSAPLRACNTNPGQSPDAAVRPAKRQQLATQKNTVKGPLKTHSEAISLNFFL